jgi:hypothetical protein
MIVPAGTGQKHESIVLVTIHSFFHNIKQSGTHRLKIKTGFRSSSDLILDTSDQTMDALHSMTVSSIA